MFCGFECFCSFWKVRVGPQPDRLWEPYPTFRRNHQALSRWPPSQPFCMWSLLQEMRFCGENMSYSCPSECRLNRSAATPANTSKEDGWSGVEKQEQILVTILRDWRCCVCLEASLNFFAQSANTAFCRGRSMVFCFKTKSETTHNTARYNSVWRIPCMCLQYADLCSGCFLLKIEPLCFTIESAHLVTCGGEGPGGAAVALVHDGVHEVAPFLAPVKAHRQHLIDVYPQWRHLLDGLHRTLRTQAVVHSLVQGHTPQKTVVGCSPSTIEIQWPAARIAHEYTAWVHLVQLSTQKK